MRIGRIQSLMIAATAGLAMSACATTADVAGSASRANEASYARDREAILAMAGDYDVTFDFREVVALAPGYEIDEQHVSHAHEIVRVIEDDGDFISLQHLLLVGGDEPVVVKHWRQDWRFEPASVLVFRGHDEAGMDTFGQAEIAAADRDGAWSQVVYQVDDSPRYGGVGRWSHDANSSTWESNLTWRPLPRRDDTTREDYDVIQAVNRHVVTDWGWAHEQDNTKLATAEGVQEIAREVGVNTYVRTENPNASVAEAYWEETEDYWASVRDAWTALENGDGDFTVADEPFGGELYMPLLGVAEQVREGAVSDEEAAEDARELIQAQTTGPAVQALASLDTE